MATTMSISQLVHQLDARQTGSNEWRSKCPIHQGNNKSAFAITEASDGKILCHCFSGCDQQKVSDYLHEIGVLNFEAGKFAPDYSRPLNDGLIPYKEFQGYKLKKVYKYPAGCSVGRYEKEVDGKIEKMTIPFFKNKGSDSGYPDSENYKRPLYSHFAISQEKDIFIVEGEKCVDACHSLGLNAITWPGGSKAVSRADWSAIRDKNVFIWPDNDEPGKKAVKELQEILNKSDNIISICDVPEGKPSGWDVADFIEEKENVSRSDVEKVFKNNQRIIRALNLTDYMNVQVKPVEEILGFLHSRSINSFYAMRGIGKSWLTMTLAYHLAIGKDFLKWKSHRPANVLYLDGEMGTAEVQERIFTIAENYGGQLPSNLFITDPDLNDGRIPKLSTPEGRAYVNLLIEMYNIEFVFVDNCSMIVGGDQNDALTWEPIQDWSIYNKTRGVSTNFVDHAGKSPTQRGSSSKQDSPHNILYLSDPYGVNNTIENRINGKHATMRIDFEKTRSSLVDNESFVAWLKRVPNPSKGNLAQMSSWKYCSNDKFDKMRVTNLYEQGYSVAEISKISGIYKTIVEGSVKEYEAKKHEIK